MARKNYYDEKYVDDMLTEYQAIVETAQDTKGRKIVINKTPRVEYLENEITKETSFYILSWFIKERR